MIHSSDDDDVSAAKMNFVNSLSARRGRCA
jgi:hypothetical protein